MQTQQTGALKNEFFTLILSQTKRFDIQIISGRW